MRDHIKLISKRQTLSHSISSQFLAIFNFIWNYILTNRNNTPNLKARWYSISSGSQRMMGQAFGPSFSLKGARLRAVGVRIQKVSRSTQNFYTQGIIALAAGPVSMRKLKMEKAWQDLVNRANRTTRAWNGVCHARREPSPSFVRTQTGVSS